MWVLNKRIPRNLKKNFSRWLAIFVLVVVCMYIVIALWGEAQQIYYNHDKFMKDYNVNDGSFATFARLNDDELAELEDLGFDIEESFYADYNVMSDDLLRVFKNRGEINKICAVDGRIAESDDEILIEQNFAEAHNIKLNDEIEIAGKKLKVCGLGCSPDYEAVLENPNANDDRDYFGTSFVTEKLYTSLIESKQAIKTEYYLYVYKKKNDDSDDDVLKEHIRGMEFDPSRVTDEYFTDMLDKAYGTKYELENALESLADASGAMASSSGENNNGAIEMNAAVGQLKEQMGTLDNLFEIDIDNLLEFNKYDDNTQIIVYANVAGRSGKACGVIVLCILSYILSIFVSHEIDDESPVIGALYSMGVKNKSLIRHYIVVPVIIAFAGGIVGTLLGMSPIGMDYELNDTLYYNSLPEFEHFFNLPLFLCGVFIPPFISAVVTFLIIRKKLLRSPLSLLRNEKKIKNIKSSRETKLSFVNAFRLKQIKNEAISSVIIFVGLLLPLILMCLSLNYLMAKMTIVKDMKKDIKFKNLYAVKYIPDEVPDNSEACYVEGLNMEYFGFDYNISLMGVERESKCFGFDTDFEKNEVYVGSGMANKFNISSGDVITLKSNDKNQYYSFKVDKVVDYAAGLTIFMDISDMRNYFGKSENHYNSLLSTEDIDIEPGRLYSVTKRDDIISSAKVFIGSIGFVIYAMVMISALIFIIIEYLMIKLLIDKASLNISLMKIFGFRNKEIDKLYIDGNFIIICLSALIGIPISKIMVDKFWFPMVSSGTKIGFNVHYPFWLYLVLIGSIVVLYGIVTLMLKKRVAEIPMTEILKNRE